ncbi:MAG: hypothetical protein EXR72_12415 [Myxococcales bacterium]|nr:hypothetical protein [Myxococcales bacterium]
MSNVRLAFFSGIILVAGCGTGTKTPVKPTTDGGAGAADMAGGGTCNAPKTQCGADCVDTNTSTDNCGACGTACKVGEACTNGKCGAMGGTAETGEPCTKATDCAGTKAICITKDTQGVMWPGGYCTSQCNPTKNDPQDDSNAMCPGIATCRGAGTSGGCELLCDKGSCRTGYSCFQTCNPTSLSMCNPTKAGSCGANKTCARLGADDVGSCQAACDPLKQGCPMDANMNDQGCFASADTGEGLCFAPVTPGGVPTKDGDGCKYLNGCSAGSACYMAMCRAYCGGMMMKACTNGKKCVDLNANVKVAKIGVCGG